MLSLGFASLTVGGTAAMIGFLQFVLWLGHDDVPVKKTREMDSVAVV